MVICWIKGSENNANVFTKNLDGSAYKKCIKMLVGQDVYIKNLPTSEQEGVGRYTRVLKVCRMKTYLYL
jgi:hypothetical protein